MKSRTEYSANTIKSFYVLFTAVSALMGLTCIALTLGLPSSAEAQIVRGLGAGALVLDDGHGNTITFVTPPGLSGSYIYYLPPPPGGSINSGFVQMGSSTGQTPYWNGNYWAPSSYLFNTATGLSITGNLSANGGTGSVGQVLTINVSGNPVWSSVSGTGTVTSVAAGTGLAGGTITTAGTISLANTAVLPGSYSSANITVDAQGRITSASSGGGSGTVTSVGLAAPAEFTVSNSPVTTSGTLTLTKANENANTVFAGPASGGAAQPMFRTLASADIPNNAANTSGTSSGFTGSLSGDVTGTQSATVVGKLQGVTVSNTAPTDGQVLGYHSGSSSWSPTAAGGTGTVTSVATGTGLSGGPITTTGTISLANTAVSAGSYTSANITIDAQGRITSASSGGSSGTVTSVGLAAPAEFTISNSPVTTAGTLTLTKANENANMVYAGPASGGAAQPTFRTLSSADIPNNAANTSGTSSGFTGSLSGDVTGTQSVTVVGKLQGVTVSNTAPTDGQVLGYHSGSSSWSPTAGGTGTVTSVATGTGLSGGPITTTGMVSLANTAVSPGSYTNVNITIDAQGRITSAASGGGSGTVTSVGLAAPAEFTVTNSPVTTAGTLTLTKANENANTVYAGPASGGATQPTFRTLASADIPNNAANTSGTSSAFTGSLSGDVTGTQSTTTVGKLQGVSVSNTAPTDGQVLEYHSGSGTWAPTVAGGSGTVTSVATGTGLSGGPITTTGTITLANTSVSPGSYTSANITVDAQGRITSAASGGGGSGWSLSGNSLSGGEVLGSTNAQPLVIETNGTERMRVLSGGNVGIGTSTPGQSLEVKNGSILLSNSGSAQQLQLQGTSTGSSTFQAGAQGSATINYTLPTAQGAASSVMANDGSGNLSWSNVGQVLFAMKSANQDFASTTPANDHQLLVSLVANATYTFDAVLSCIDSNSNGASGKVAISVPSGASALFGVNSAGGYFLSNPSAGTASASISPVPLENGTSGDQNFVEVKGIVINGSTSGNLQMKFGIASSGTNYKMIVTQNSFLKVTRIQ